MGKRALVAESQDVIPTEEEAKKGLLEYMNNMVTLRKTMPKPTVDFRFLCMEDLILQHGKFFTVKSKPKNIRFGTLKECFTNAAKLAISNPNLIYCEGYSHHGILPLHHAWVVDKQGNVIDNTWREPGYVYFGIAFDTKYLTTTICKTKSYGLIDRWKDCWPLLTGKDKIEEAIAKS